MTVAQLINKLKKFPPDAKIVMHNTDVFVEGMYYVTKAEYDNTMGEEQVEIMTDYKKTAKGWEDD